MVFAILAQGFYKPQPLFEKARFVDEIIGGILGLIEAGLILLCFVVILDTFFRSTGIPADPDELPYLRVHLRRPQRQPDRHHVPRHGHPGVHDGLRAS